LNSGVEMGFAMSLAFVDMRGISAAPLLALSYPMTLKLVVSIIHDEKFQNSCKLLLHL